MRLNSYIVEEKEKIKIIVLTSHLENGSSEDLYKTAGRIKEECEKRKQECHVIFSEDSYIDRDENNIPRIYDSTKDGDKGIILDKNNTVVFVRGSVSRTKACLDLVSQIERHEVFCVNSRDSIETCSDKFRTIITLANADIPTPKTSLITNEQGIKIAFEKIGENFPVILKTITGSKGIGVFSAADWPSLKSTLQALWKIDEEAEILIQEFIDTDFDIRVHVLGNEVIAAMKRFRIKDDFRSNYSLGGKIEEIKLTDEQKELAIRSSNAVGSIWSGVDMMIDGKKTMVIEVNSSPGTEGIEKATKTNIVEKVLDYVDNKEVWTKKAIECGYVEKLKIKGIGDLDAKMDTGNGSYCVIHADDWKVEDDEVIWHRKGKEYTHELETMKEVHIGGVDNETDKRPVIRLDVEFYGTTYKNVLFTLSDREGFIADILINRNFIRNANLVINPAKKYVLGNVIKEAVEPDTKQKQDNKQTTKTDNVDKTTDVMINQPVLDKNEISGFVKNFDDKTEKEVDDNMEKILDALDTKFHCGKPKKGSFGYKAQRNIALYILDALKKGERNVNTLAKLVHKAWSETAKDEHEDDVDITQMGEAKEIKKPVKKPIKVEKPQDKKKEVKKDSKKEEPKRLTKNDVDPKTFEWWNSHSAQTQKAFVEKHKDGDIAQLVKSNILKYGVKFGENAKSGKGEEEQIKTDKTLQAIKSDVKLSPEEKEAHTRMYLASVAYENLPVKIKRQYGEEVKEIASVLAPFVKKGKKLAKKEEEERERDKTISKTTSGDDKIRKTTFKTTNEKYYENNKKQFVDKKEQIRLPKWLMTNSKFHSKDLYLLERLLNAKDINTNKKVSMFTEGEEAGAGQIASQTGELMTMVLCSLSDSDAEKFKSDIEKHFSNRYKKAVADLESKGKTLTSKTKDNIDKDYPAQQSWLDAAMDTRKAMKFSVAEAGGYDIKDVKLEDVVHRCAWDTKEGVNSMGFKYSEKEKSTDVFFVINDNKGNKKIVEASLKKSFNALLLNSGIGDIADNCPDWSDDLQPSKYQSDMNTLYKDGNTKSYQSDMEKRVSAIIKNKEADSPFSHEVLSKFKNETNPKKIVDEICNKGYSRNTRKLQLFFHKERMEKNVESKKVFNKLDNTSRGYISNIIKQMKSNDGVRAYMLDILKENVPLQGILNSREYLLAGENALSPKVCQQIFSTKNWNDISEKLDILEEHRKDKNGKVVTDEDGNPISDYNLVYNVKGKSDPVKIATIGLREDGTLYGLTVKFELSFYKPSKEDSLGYKCSVLNGNKSSKGVQEKGATEDDKDTEIEDKVKSKKQNSGKIFDIFNKEVITENIINEKLRKIFNP